MKKLTTQNIIILIILFCITTLCSFALVVYIRLGGFKTVSIEINFFGPKYLIYKNHTGAYYKINSSITEVEKWVQKNGYDCQTTFGEYLSDPEQIQPEYLKSRAGCVIHNIPKQIPSIYHTKKLPKTKSIIAHFKGSPAIGPWKVYPKVKEFIKTKGLTTQQYPIEFYTLKDKTIQTTYVFPLE